MPTEYDVQLEDMFTSENPHAVPPWITILMCHHAIMRQSQTARMPVVRVQQNAQSNATTKSHIVLRRVTIVQEDA